MDDLSYLRQQIDEVDFMIQNALQHRLELVNKIGRYKKEHNIPVLNSSREEEVLSKIKNNEIRKIYETILIVSKELQE